MTYLGMITKMRKVKHKSIKCRLLILSSVLMLITTGVVSLTFYNKSYKQIVGLLEQKALDIAKAASYIVEGDRLEEIVASLDREDTYYKELLHKFQHLNQDIGQGMLYIVTDQSPNYYTYLVDGSQTVEIGFNQSKQEFAPDLESVFNTGMSYTTAPYYVNSFNKYYISAFVPIFNNRQEVVGVVEYDYEGKDFELSLKSINSTILKVTIVLIFLALVGNYLILRRVFRPMENLVKTIGIIAQGDMTVQMEVKTEDEIGTIKRAVNENVTKIRGILGKIKYSSQKVTLASKSILVSSRDATEAFEELAISINGIAEMAEKQTTDTNETLVILEALSEDGEHIFEQIQKGKKLMMQFKSAFKEIEDCELNEEKKIQLQLINAGNEELKELVTVSERCLDDMATHISSIFSRMNETHEMMNVIELNTVGLAAITEEQMATSQEFTAMAELLREQAKELDESIGKFII